MKPVVYVAGKLTDDPVGYIQNMKRMIRYAGELRRMGFAVVVPCLDFLEGLVGNLDRKDYMTNSLEVMLCCDAVALVPGNWEDSKGTKAEIAIAEGIGIEVLHSRCEAIKYLDEERERTKAFPPYLQKSMEDLVEEYCPEFLTYIMGNENVN